MDTRLLPDADDGEFLKRCYNRLLGRDPDPAGRDHHLRALDGGLSREALVQAFIAGDEFAMRFNSAAPAAPGAEERAARFVPEGHFYSPIPAQDDYLRTFAERALPEPTPEEVNEAGQLELLDVFETYYGEVPFPAKPVPASRYHLDNGAFNHFDAIVLYCMIRHFKPRRIIEVGSGYSSAAILDTCDAFMSDPVDITFVEPYPETLHRCLRADDPARCRIVAEKVQDVPLDLFDSLDEHDILFIDSSHVAKFGSDLNHLLFRIIPRLRKGVVVHFHDIFRNFDYPLEWLREGRAWNEAYLVRAFLASNRDWRVLFFNDWMAHRHWTELERRMPLCTVQPEGSPFRNSGVSLWLQKVSG